jgi:hypothetical protein
MNPKAAATPQARTTSSHSGRAVAGPSVAARSAEGAIACGMFEMKRRRKGSPLIARLCQVALSQAVDGYFVDCDGDFDYLDCLCNPTTPIYKRGQVVPAT